MTSLVPMDDIIQSPPHPLQQQQAPPPPPPPPSLPQEYARPLSRLLHEPRPGASKMRRLYHFATLPQTSHDLGPPPSKVVLGQHSAPLPQHKPQPPIASPPRAPLFKYPNQDLLDDDKRKDFNEICVPLYNALMIEDWENAGDILNGRQYLLNSSITENDETPLHVVASAQSNTKSIDFVQNLVNTMDRKDLLLQNRNGNTALSLAAASGSVDIARIMVTGNSDLPTIANVGQMMPLYIAVIYKNLEMVDFLYEKSQKMDANGWTPTDRGWVFSASVEVEFFDFTLQILDDHLELAQNMYALLNLARKPSVFNETEPDYFRRIVTSSILHSTLL